MCSFRKSAKINKLVNQQLERTEMKRDNKTGNEN